MKAVHKHEMLLSIAFGGTYEYSALICVVHSVVAHKDYSAAIVVRASISRNSTSLGRSNVLKIAGRD